jgi:hypothetical protein
MTTDRVPEFVAKGITIAFTFGILFWYITMKLMALGLQGP